MEFWRSIVSYWNLDIDGWEIGEGRATLIGRVNHKWVRVKLVAVHIFLDRNYSKLCVDAEHIANVSRKISKGFETS